MIPNLNFYDIYGYLIPGLTLAIVFRLPYGLITGRWPESSWTSALIAVVIGYVLGHLVQILARNALPSKTIEGRYPSEALLDEDDKNFSDVFKEQLRTRIKQLSGIDVRTDLKKSAVTDDVKAQRNEGFRYCRDALLLSKNLSYAEQLQGMYTLMAGLVVAFALGAPFALGWTVSTGKFQVSALFIVALGLLPTAVTAVIGLGETDATPTDRARLMLVFLMIAVFGAGYLLGSERVSTAAHRVSLGAMTLVYTFAASSCYSAYKYFTKVYAQTVYHAFSLYEKPEKKSSPAQSGI
jgi:hypothetical protein